MYNDVDFSQFREFILNALKRCRESQQLSMKFIYISQKIILISLIIIDENIVNKKFLNFRKLIKNHVVVYD